MEIRSLKTPRSRHDLFCCAALQIVDNISQFHRKITPESFFNWFITTIYLKEPFRGNESDF